MAFGRAGSDSDDADLYFDLLRFFRAALAPSLPRAVRAFFGRRAIVLFRRAVLAAFLIFRFAAARCFSVVIFSSEQVSRPKAYAGLALNHSQCCHHLDVKFALSCTKNRRMRETRSWARFLPVVQLDRAGHRNQMFRPLLPETLTG